MGCIVDLGTSCGLVLQLLTFCMLVALLLTHPTRTSYYKLGCGAKYRSCISWSVFLTLPTTLTVVNKHYGMFVTELLLRVNPLKQFLRHLCAVTHRRSLRHIYIRVFSYFIDYVCHLLRLYCRRGPPCALNITLLTLGPSWMPLVSMLHFLFGVTLCGISPVRACIVGMAPLVLWTHFDISVASILHLCSDFL